MQDHRPTAGARPDSDDARPGEQVPLEEKPKAEDAKPREDQRLDEGVEESFPASDPVSVKITKI